MSEMIRAVPVVVVQDDFDPSPRAVVEGATPFHCRPDVQMLVAVAFFRGKRYLMWLQFEGA